MRPHIFVLTLLAAASTYAQTTTGISGRVFDPSKAPAPGATTHRRLLFPAHWSGSTSKWNGGVCCK